MTRARLATASNLLTSGSAMKGLATPTVPAPDSKWRFWQNWMHLKSIFILYSFLLIIFFYSWQIFFNPFGRVEKVEQSKHAAVLRCLPFPSTRCPSAAVTLSVGGRVCCHFNPRALSVKFSFSFKIWWAAAATKSGDATNSPLRMRKQLSLASRGYGSFQWQFINPSSSRKPLNLPHHTVLQARDEPLGTAVGLTRVFFFFIVFFFPYPSLFSAALLRLYTV